MITLVLDRGFQLFSLVERLLRLLDFALRGTVVTFAALVEAHARFVHGLQHQPRNLADLAGLFDELAAVFTLGFLQGIGAIIGEPGLQHVKVIGHARHRPTGHLQGQILGLSQ